MVDVDTKISIYCHRVRGEVGTLRRLLSHALIGGALVLAVAALAALTAVVLYVHVVADLIADIRHGARPAGPEP